MLVAQEKWLPRYAGAIDGAKARLAAKAGCRNATAGCGAPAGALDRSAARGARPQGGGVSPDQQVVA